ncbi:hypothetical protein R80B4_01661 [Fibrobacteres bacterium R8-0-B4]
MIKSNDNLRGGLRPPSLQTKIGQKNVQFLFSATHPAGGKSPPATPPINMRRTAARKHIRQNILTILSLIVFGAGGGVFAQDDVESSLDDPVNTVDTVNTVDNDGIDNPPKAKKSGKSGKSSKSEKTVETADGDAAVLSEVIDDDPASAPKSSKSKSKSGKSDKSSSAGNSTAAASGATLKYKGLVAAGVDFNRKVNRKEGNEVESKRVAKGELELSAQPVKKVRAEIGIEYNINGRVMAADSLGVRKFVNIIDPMAGSAALTDIDLELLKGLPLGPFVTIDKLYAQYNIVDNGAVRAGIMKKSFGPEERAGLDERYFLKRSIISDGLETLGFLDHDLTIAYRHDLLSDALRLTGAFSWSVTDSTVYLQNYSAHYRPAKNMEFLLAGIVKHSTDTVGGNPSTAYAVSLSARYEAVSWCVSEAEATFGANPLIRKINDRKTALFGARLQEQFPINIDTKVLRNIVPVTEVSVFTADLDSGYTETQIKAGVTLGFAKNSAFQFRNNFGTIIRTPKAGESSIRRYRFDSEVIVIF